MIPFRYTRVGRPTLDEFTVLLQNGDSIVLLGPQLIGKRFIIGRLCERLAALSFPDPIVVPCRPHDTTSSPGNALRAAITPATRVVASPRSVFAAVDDRLRGPSDSALLILTNVDSLSYADAREVLVGIRTRIEDRRHGFLSVVITGELDLRELVYGPNSEFNCANQYVVQGLDFDLFEAFVTSYARTVGLTFATADEPMRYLFEVTGGNIYLFRLILWAVIERSTLDRTSLSRELDRGTLEIAVSSKQIPWEFGPGTVRHAINRIAHESDAWPRLREMLSRGETPAKQAPDLLELTGVAIRKDNVLRASSPIVERMLKAHYTSRRFAELYCCDRDWAGALEHFAETGPDDRRRKGRQEEVEEAEPIVRAMAVELYSEVPNGLAAVRKLFVRTCRYILGFDTVTFWRRNVAAPRRGDEGWRYDIEANGEATSEPAGFREVLDQLDSCDARPQETRNAILRSLPGSRSSYKNVVIVGNPRDTSQLAPEWKRLTEYLVDHFGIAYERALAIERDRERAAVRARFSNIYDDIVQSLGRDVINVMDALLIAAKGIRENGYKRALFCLVDATETEIRGVLDLSHDHRVNLAEMTRYALNEPLADIQPYVCWTARPKVVADAATDPLTNKWAVNAADLRAFAVLPLTNRDGWVMGTLHIEREDGDVPSKEEIEDLEAFGRRLAIAMDQCERVSFLQTALDKLSEPVFLIDRCERLRYANESAARLLKVQRGWHGRQAFVRQQWRESSESSRRIAPLLAESMEQNERRLSHIDFHDGVHPRVSEAMTDAITCKLEQHASTIGGVCHLHDLTYLYQVFEALRILQQSATSDELVRNILEAMKRLGHKWARLYLVSKDQPEWFQSQECFGIADTDVERRFRAGAFRLKPSNEPGHEAWVCVNERMPKVFVCDPEAADRHTKRSIRGLEAMVVVDPQCPPELAKAPGEYWIDFPILAGSTVLGKVTLECNPESFGPEDIEFLKRLSGLISGLLDSIGQRQRVERQELILASSERAVFDTCHNIATVLAAHPILLYRYRKLADRFPEIRRLNDEYEAIQKQISEMIERVKRLLTPVDVRREPHDIVALIRSVLTTSMPEDSWQLGSDDDVLIAEIDAHQMRNVFYELVQNSRQCCPDEVTLRVSVRIRVERSLRGESVVIDYRDNGPGVPVELKSRIFENFFSQRRGGNRGTGLGLGLIRRIIKEHGGSIVEIGEPGKFAKFQIEILRWQSGQQTDCLAHPNLRND